MIRFVPALLAAAGLSLAGCVAASTAPPPTATATPRQPQGDATDVVDELPEPIRYAWDDPVALDLGDGWVVGPCGGDAPVRCVSRGGTLVGTIELGGHPLDAPVADHAAWLRRTIDDLLATTSADRTATCGPGHAVTMVSRPTSLAGVPGLQYDLRTRSPGTGRPVTERVLGVIAVDGDQVVWLSGTAIAPDGCLARLGSEFLVEDLDDFADRLVGIARGLEMDPPTTR